jgi:hypothetical protein
MSTASDGARRERRVRDEMIADGWSFIMRAAASKGPADLAMAHPEHGLALVQVGSKSKTLGPADRERLCDAADICCGIPLLAIIRPREKTQMWVVDRGKPAGWAVWP